MMRAVPPRSGARSFDCVGLGLNAFDRIITVPKYPPADGKVAFDELIESGGGQVATALAALGTWDCRTRYIGRIGDDYAGAVVTRSLQRCGVDIDDLVTVPGAVTQQAFIVADQSDHSRTIFWHRDNRLIIPPDSVRRDLIGCGRILLIDGHDEPAAIQAARHARDTETPIVLDIDQPRPRSRELVELADCVFSTRQFAMRLTGSPSIRDALEQLHRLGPSLVGVTLGSEGCLALDGERFEQVPSFAVPTIDSTGAGDVFHAALVYGLLQDWPLRRILRFANAAGALATTVIGVQSHLPTLQHIETLMGSPDHE